MAHGKRNRGINKGFILPTNPQPTGRKYICVPIPDDPQHIDNFFGALFELTMWFNYMRDDNQTGKQCADVWRDIFQELVLQESCGVTDPCCPEQIALLQQILAGQNSGYALNLQQHDTGTPQSFAPNAPQFWDGEPTTSDYSNTNYDAALCQAVNDFMGAALTQAGQDLGMGSTILGIVGTLVGVFFPPAGFVAAIVAGLTRLAFEAALADTQAYNNVICCVLRGLRGREISAASLATALDDSGCELSEVNEGIFKSIFTTHAANQNNYRSFTAHYANALNSSQTATNCECCGIGQDDLRLDYRWFYNDSGYTQTRNMSMRREGNLLKITPYKQTYQTNDNEIGFKLYSPSDCCFRARFVTPNFLVPFSGNFYSPTVPQRQGDVIGCPPADGFTSGTNWFCFKSMLWRWAPQSASYPAWLDAEIVIELDLDYACI